MLRIKGAASAMQASASAPFQKMPNLCTEYDLSPSDIGLIRKLLVAGRNPQLPKYQLREFTENSSERFEGFPL